MRTWVEFRCGCGTTERRSLGVLATLAFDVVAGWWAWVSSGRIDQWVTCGCGIRRACAGRGGPGCCWAQGLRTDRTASVVICGHAFIQNLRRGHYELAAETTHRHLRVSAAFADLVETV